LLSERRSTLFVGEEKGKAVTGKIGRGKIAV